MSDNTEAVLLFDGVCALCHGFVTFVIDRDASKHFVFAPLQSDEGRRLLSAFGIEAPDAAGAHDTMVLIENGQAHLRSSAVLRVLGRLTLAWRTCAFLLVVPGRLRDVLYRLVARRRYRWFGQQTECRVPDAELRSRFLEHRPDVLQAALSPQIAFVGTAVAKARPARENTTPPVVSGTNRA